MMLLGEMCTCKLCRHERKCFCPYGCSFIIGHMLAGGYPVLQPRIRQEATIYNYTLLKKIRHHPVSLLLHGVLPLPLAIFYAASVSVWSLLWAAAGVIGLAVLYAAVARLYLKLMAAPARGPWSWQLSPPWIGVLPELHTPISLLLRVHRQMFWLGLAAIGCLYPWLPHPYVILLLVLHLWYMLPRFYMMHALKRVNKSGLVKINSGDTCYYSE